MRKSQKVFCNFNSNSERTSQVSESRADLQRRWEKAEHSRVSEKEGTRRHQVFKEFKDKEFEDKDKDKDKDKEFEDISPFKLMVQHN